MDDERQVITPSYRVSFLHVAITVVAAFASLLDDAVELMAAHSNWKIERRHTEEAMRADIERIVSGE